jgi:hypothetical protein
MYMYDPTYSVPQHSCECRRGSRSLGSGFSIPWMRCGGASVLVSDFIIDGIKRIIKPTLSARNRGLKERCDACLTITKRDGSKRGPGDCMRQ